LRTNLRISYPFPSPGPGKKIPHSTHPQNPHPEKGRLGKLFCMPINQSRSCCQECRTTCLLQEYIYTSYFLIRSNNSKMRHKIYGRILKNVQLGKTVCITFRPTRKPIPTPAVGYIYRVCWIRIRQRHLRKFIPDGAMSDTLLPVVPSRTQNALYRTSSRKSAFLTENTQFFCHIRTHRIKLGRKCPVPVPFRIGREFGQILAKPKIENNLTNHNYFENLHIIMKQNA
jgi:hypothetical protein